MIEIIPAIDIIDGRCVRLSQGDYSRQKTYDYDPVTMVARYADSGVTRVHVVDLDGAKVAMPQNLAVLEKMARIDGVCIEWGGGLKSETAVRQIFDAGATYAIVGSVAAKQPSLFAGWLDSFGADRMVLGADVRDGKVSVNGWLEDLDVSIDDLISQFAPHGLNQVICTDISRDGMLQGPSFELYTRLQTDYPEIDFTVSGGISSMDDILRLDTLNLRKVIVGKAIYEGRISLQDIQKYIVSH
jgi:phosphoribosylformimino-5-aminoimidazole carboxamide ribotide isomerase